MADEVPEVPHRFQPAEEQFDLPALSIHNANRRGGEIEQVGDQPQRAGLAVFDGLDDHFAERDRRHDMPTGVRRAECPRAVGDHARSAVRVGQGSFDRALQFGRVTSGWLVADDEFGLGRPRFGEESSATAGSRS